MSNNTIKEELSVILESIYSTQLYFVLKSDGEYSIRLADLEDENTAPEIQNMYVSYIQDNIINNDDISISNLSDADDRGNTIYRYDFEEYPKDVEIIKDFKIEDAVKLPKFDFKKDNINNLFGYIIYIGNMGGGAILFKKHYPISLIKRDSFLLGAIKSTVRLERICANDIIRLNKDVQIIRIGNDIFVLDLKMLERNMGFHTIIKKNAYAAIQEVENLNLVEEPEVLKDEVDNIAFARKLVKIAKDSQLVKSGIDKKTIIEYIKKTPVLSDKFKYSKDGTQIRLDTKKSKNDFLTLMSDSFLYSELTKIYYTALSKDNISVH
jgi:hypothetical protein